MKLKTQNSKLKTKTNLKSAIDFHGHLGPYLVLGILAGETALKRLGCKKYFGLEVKVFGASKKPKSCMIDGLQLSTGATYGKGNIEKLNSNKIQILIHNHNNNRKIRITLKDPLIGRLNSLKTHKDSELFARELYRTDSLKIFNFLTPDS